ncbi:response regulator transcription factor [Sphingomonas sp. AR_OL41]|uniref:LuxR C-terminal-related transcriptional regulator n=1 Tax=Sphingomonas sp. AR_OL41 TaxID=3042729 RepID=UPI002480C786|nr:response regulator transcription factor [Sphingomonas sp. AR_OL41]MDH7975802.1 response regulator transcription factor [Sphingomonas sp. AR_OL41]
MVDRILIADDHPICSEAVALAARVALPTFHADQVATLELAEQAARGCSAYRCVVLDLMLPDASGFSGLLRLQRILPGVPIAIISSIEDDSAAARALHLGAAAFLPKALPFAELSAAIGRLVAGERQPLPTADPATGALRTLRNKIDTLTAGQLRVVMALRAGQLNKQIAHDLGLGEATVKTHLAAAFRKLGVSNRTQAVLLFRQLDVDADTTPSRHVGAVPA